MSALRKNTWTVMVIVAATCVALVSTGPMAFAAPIPGPGFGSSNLGSPQAPGTSAFDTITIGTNFLLSNYPAGTTSNVEVSGGQRCVKEIKADLRFVVDRGDLFSTCYYQSTYLDYKISVVTPGLQRPVVHARVEYRTEPALVGATGYATVRCYQDWGSTACYDDTGRQFVGTSRNFTLEPVLSGVPKGPIPSWKFCAGEGAVCTAPAGSTISYGFEDDVVKTVKKSSGDLPCTGASFGGKDPAPNVFKDCFIIQ